MKKKNNEVKVKVVPKDSLEKDFFGFERATEKDISKDGIVNGIALVKGTLKVYDHMISDPRVDDESRKKLEELRDIDINIIVDGLKEEIEKRLSNGESIDNIDKVVDLFRNDLKDLEYAKYLEYRINSKGVEVDSVDFSIMSNEELYNYLNSLEDKIREAVRVNPDISSNKEVHVFLDLGVKLQEEIDKRLELSKSKNSDLSLEDELDNLAKEQDKVKRAKHFSDDTKDQLRDEIDEEIENAKGRRRR